MLERKGFEPEAYLNEDRRESRKQHWEEGKRVWYSTFVDTGSTIHIVVNRIGGLPASPKRVAVTFRGRGQRRDPNCQYLIDQRPVEKKDPEIERVEAVADNFVIGINDPSFIAKQKELIAGLEKRRGAILIATR